MCSALPGIPRRLFEAEEVKIENSAHLHTPHTHALIHAQTLYIPIHLQLAHARTRCTRRTQPHAHARTHKHTHLHTRSYKTIEDAEGGLKRENITEGRQKTFKILSIYYFKDVNLQKVTVFHKTFKTIKMEWKEIR